MVFPKYGEALDIESLKKNPECFGSLLSLVSKIQSFEIPSLVLKRVGEKVSTKILEQLWRERENTK
jgi:hypothetical protein